MHACKSSAAWYSCYREKAMSEQGSALHSVLEWSEGRPDWQRDALRRLYESGALSVQDEEELYAIARSARGVGDTGSVAGSVRPLSNEHLPAPPTPEAPVTLEVVRDVRHVNALASDESLVFGESGLTAIYGDNASGKSGYARILRQVCRTRGGDRRVLPNVFDRRQPGRPTATITFRVGDTETAFQWRSSEQVPDALTQMSFFDSQSASALVTSQNELPYAPVAVDLLRQLAETCKRLKDRAMGERDALRQRRSATITDPPVREAGAVHRVLSSLKSTTKFESIQELAALSAAEEKRMEELQALLADNRDRLAKAARHDRERLERLRTLGDNLRNELVEERVAEHRDLMREAAQARTAARTAATEAFDHEPLKGVGSDTWRRLWEAAREYSSREAYPAREFPNTGAGARCVLCHQELGDGARGRMTRFEEFVQERLETTAQSAERSLNQSRARFRDSTPNRAVLRQLLEDSRLPNEGLAEALRRYFILARWRLHRLLRLTQKGEAADWASLPGLPSFPDNAMAAEIEKHARREHDLAVATQSDERQRLRRELEDLTDRQWLAKELPAVRDEINRLGQLERMERLIRDLDSAAVTRKSTEITEQVVSKQLVDAFNAELERLSVGTAKVRINRAPGRYGVPRYQIELDGLIPVQVKIDEVLSEGEHRAIALAGFLAELETSGDRSALIFDDPVSSLDHNWRHAVARRLVEEAERRQVVVFTHDLVFLLMLQEAADNRSVEMKHWRLMRRGADTGVPIEEPPGRQVNKRIGDLNRRIQEAGAVKRREGDAAYAPAARSIYRLLRDAWERGVEEVLLNGVVQRFGREIQTRKLPGIGVITKEDLQAVKHNMTKCSRLSHDEADAINDPVPEPEEIQEDIAVLKEWCKAIRDRRG